MVERNHDTRITDEELYELRRIAQASRLIRCILIPSITVIASLFVAWEHITDLFTKLMVR